DRMSSAYRPDDCGSVLIVRSIPGERRIPEGRGATLSGEQFGLASGNGVVVRNNDDVDPFVKIPMASQQAVRSPNLVFQGLPGLSGNENVDGQGSAKEFQDLFFVIQDAHFATTVE